MIPTFFPLACFYSQHQVVLVYGCFHFNDKSFASATMSNNKFDHWMDTNPSHVSRTRAFVEWISNYPLLTELCWNTQKKLFSKNSCANIIQTHSHAHARWYCVTLVAWGSVESIGAKRRRGANERTKENEGGIHKHILKAAEYGLSGYCGLQYDVRVSETLQAKCEVRC